MKGDLFFTPSGKFQCRYCAENPAPAMNCGCSSCHRLNWIAAVKYGAVDYAKRVSLALEVSSLEPVFIATGDDFISEI